MIQRLPRRYTRKSDRDARADESQLRQQPQPISSELRESTIIDNVNDEIRELTPPRRGRPATRQRKLRMARALREGTATTIDKSWLLEQLLRVYNHEIRPVDKLRALELMARISGYGNRYGTDEPEDERKAIASLMADMETDGTYGTYGTSGLEPTSDNTDDQ